MKIIADNKIPFLESVFESRAELVCIPGNQIARSDLYDADALITRSVTKCNESLLKNTKIKFIATATIGNDHIDKEFCKKHNIEWVVAEGCNSTAVTQYFITALLNLVKKKKLSLTGLTLGIIGVGNIGTRIEKAAEGLGMRVLLNDPPRAEKEGDRKFSSLDILLQQADIITIHVPLISIGKNNTLHLADSSFFERLKKSIIFINTSRGEVVETEALKSAIRSKKVKFSIIDVWENEPSIDTGLLNLVDIATAHIAGYSLEGKVKATAMSVNAISRYFGLELDNWNPEIENPLKNNIKIQCFEKSYPDILYDMVVSIYDIEEDDHELRSHFSDFESIRVNYVFRHEFSAYTFELQNCSDEILDSVIKLGFKVINK